MRPSLNSLRATVAAGPPYSEELLTSLKDDQRAGARALYETCLRHARRTSATAAHTHEMFRFEREAFAHGFHRVAGVDEAGRGPLAGPIVAGAVVLKGPVEGLDDSKLLTEAQREALFVALMSGGHAVAHAVVPVAEIDTHGIQAANFGAMLRAVQGLDPVPDFLLVDGFSIPGCPLPQSRLVKGDRRSQSIAAASIVAKVLRDRHMIALDREYPEYGFAHHKGYATREHLEALERCGPCPAHRTSFAPISRSVETGLLFELKEG